MISLHVFINPGKEDWVSLERHQSKAQKSENWAMQPQKSMLTTKENPQ